MHSKYDKIQEIQDNYKEQLPKPEPEWPHDVRKAVVFINEHIYNEKLTVTWVKKKLSIKGNNFSTKFKYYISFAPKKYILHHRVKTAKLLLTDHRMLGISIFETALIIGFSGQAAFTNAFKHQTGFTPNQWQK
jgi:AraC-like DNA-binding protein